MLEHLVKCILYWRVVLWGRIWRTEQTFQIGGFKQSVKILHRNQCLCYSKKRRSKLFGGCYWDRSLGFTHCNLMFFLVFVLFGHGKILKRRESFFDWKWFACEFTYVYKWHYASRYSLKNKQIKPFTEIVRRIQMDYQGEETEDKRLEWTGIKN